MKRHYTFSNGESFDADGVGLRKLLNENREYLANYEELYECLDDDSFVARGNGFCETRYSGEFIEGQMQKYESRIRELEGWLDAPAARKEEMRSVMRRLKREHSLEALEHQSNIIIEMLEARSEFADAQTVMLYDALPDEVQTRSCIERWCSKKRIVLPTVRGNDIIPVEIRPDSRFVTGDFDIREPEGLPYTGGYDLIVVPGMAFDPRGDRLGRGRGYYDRFLRQHADTPKIGICFDFQLVEQVPTEPDDITMDIVIHP